MTDNQRKIDPGRPCSGRKATRTRTVPSLKSNNLKKEETGNRLDSANKLYTSNYGLNSNSHLELVANKCKALSAGQSCNLNSLGSQPISSTITEAKTIYGLRQTLKDILETRVNTDSNEVCLNRHRKELARVWSRERVTVTETRIYSRPPSTTNSNCQSGYGSSMADVSNDDPKRQLIDNIPRKVSITVSNENLNQRPSQQNAYTETNIDQIDDIQPRNIPINIISLEGSSNVTGPSPIIKRPKAINFISTCQKNNRRPSGSDSSTKRVSIREDHEDFIEDRNSQYSLKSPDYDTNQLLESDSPNCVTREFQYHPLNQSVPEVPERSHQNQDAYENIKPIQTSTPIQETQQEALLEEEEAGDDEIYRNWRPEEVEEEYNIYNCSMQESSDDRYAGENYYRSDIENEKSSFIKVDNSNRLHMTSDDSSQMVPINLEDKLDFIIDSTQGFSSITDPNSSTSSVYTTAKSSPFPTNPPTPIEHVGQFYPVEDLVPERLKCSVNKVSSFSKASNQKKQASDYDQMKNFYTSSQYYSNRDFNEADRMIQQSVHFRTIVRKDQTGYGFTVCGSHPVTVRTIRSNGTAERAGLRPGDEIIKVNGIYVENHTHSDVVSKIKSKPNVCFMLRRNRLILESELARQSLLNRSGRTQDSDVFNMSNAPPISEEDISDRRQRHQQRRRRAREARMQSIRMKTNDYTDSQEYSSNLNDPPTDNSIAEDDMTLADYNDDGNSTNYEISDIEQEDVPRVS